VILLTSAQSAWLAPLCAIIPSKAPDVRKVMIGAIETSQTRFVRRLVLAALAVPVVGWLAGAWSGVVAFVSEGAVLASWVALQREYLRSVLVMYSRPQSMLRADLVYTIVLLPAIAFAVFGAKFHSIWAVAALIVAGWAGGRAAYRSVAAGPPMRVHTGARCGRWPSGRPPARSPIGYWRKATTMYLRPGLISPR